jgi:site-specific DNA-cytosine methylase
MRILELFCGTKSFTKVWEGDAEIITVDIMRKYEPTILADLLTFDYKAHFTPGEFDIIWAGTPCNTFSRANTDAKKLHKRETIGRPLLLKTHEIIDYLKPKLWFIENPDGGAMRHEESMKDLPFYRVDYCKYGYPYRKRTRIWTNLLGWEPKMCDYDCPYTQPGKRKHRYSLAINNSKNTGWSANRRGYEVLPDFGKRKEDRYSMPPLLMEEMKEACLKHITDA